MIIIYSQGTCLPVRHMSKQALQKDHEEEENLGSGSYVRQLNHG